eukprot:scaffold91507_cov25-Phaeocystis_antarctica.AAC.1
MGSWGWDDWSRGFRPHRSMSSKGGTCALGACPNPSPNPHPHPSPNPDPNPHLPLTLPLTRCAPWPAAPITPARSRARGRRAARGCTCGVTVPTLGSALATSTRAPSSRCRTVT